MKKLSLSLVFGATLALTACGGHEEHPHAVDKLAEAEAAAKAKAPQAETVKFADEGAETIGGVGGVNPKPAQTDDKAKTEEKTENTAEAKADDKAENTATENAAKADDKQDNTAKADDKKAEEAPAKTEEAKTDDKAAEAKKAE